MDYIGTNVAGFAQLVGIIKDLLELLHAPHAFAIVCGCAITIGLTQGLKSAPFMQSRRRQSEARQSAQRWYLRVFSIFVGSVFGAIFWHPPMFEGWRAGVEPVAAGALIGALAFLVYDIWHSFIKPLGAKVLVKFGAGRSRGAP